MVLERTVVKSQLEGALGLYSRPSSAHQAYWTSEGTRRWMVGGAANFLVLVHLASVPSSYWLPARFC